MKDINKETLLKHVIVVQYLYVGVYWVMHEFIKSQERLEKSEVSVLVKCQMFSIESCNMHKLIDFSIRDIFPLLNDSTV